MLGTTSTVDYTAVPSYFHGAVMIREPERKKEQEKRRPASRLSPWS
jgi:hypothetical protein